MEDVLKHCQICLSNERELHPICNMRSLIQHLNFWEFKEEGGVCWECRSVTQRFSRLKQQAVESQRLLSTCRRREDLKSSSTLSVITKCGYNYQYYYKYDPLVAKDNTEVTVKVEANDEDCDVFDDKCNDSDDEKPLIPHERAYDINDLLKNYDEKAEIVDSSEVYVEILNTKVNEQRRTKKIKKSTVKLKSKKIKIDDEEELMKKFTKVVYSEEEMVKNREEKRNQPNYKKIPFKCDTCVLGFTKENKYKGHMKEKHSEKNGEHLCPVCQIRFPTEEQVDRHKKKHYSCYRCRLCKYETLKLWSALSHCRLKHDGDTSDRIHCQYCDTIAKSQEELSQHVRSEHAVLCNVCGEKFKGPSTLRSHKIRIHGVKREFSCDICNKTFNTKSRLESHTVTHNTSLAQSLAYCALCRVQYKNIYVYRNHLSTSATHAQQAYQCTECNKKFASKVYWKKHYNFYHLHKSQFRCEDCNKFFISEWRLKNHQKTKHGLARSRDHHCNVCGKQFFTLSTLKGHQLTHSEQRSFMCSECGDTFRQRPALYTHCKLVHRGDKRINKHTGS